MSPDSQPKYTFDWWLKRILPNHTVMRRYIAGAYIGAAVFGTVASILIGRVQDNTTRSSAAICRIVEFAERTAADSKVPKQAENLARLGRDMRDLVKRCPPLSTK
jgi:hypothetical protein